MNITPIVILRSEKAVPEYMKFAEESRRVITIRFKLWRIFGEHQAIKS